MKCTIAQQHIYLYSELSAQERQSLHVHLDTCERCAKVFQAMQATMALVSQSQQPLAVDHAALTARIIQAVAATSRRPLPTNWWLGQTLLRYGMAACSVLLIVFFVAEHRIAAAPVNVVYAKSGAPLRMAGTIHRVLTQDKTPQDEKCFYASWRRESCTHSVWEKIKVKYSSNL